MAETRARLAMPPETEQPMDFELIEAVNWAGKLGGGPFTRSQSMDDAFPLLG